MIDLLENDSIDSLNALLELPYKIKRPRATDFFYFFYFFVVGGVGGGGGGWGGGGRFNFFQMLNFRRGRRSW